MVESQLDEMEGNYPALRRELLKAFALLKISAIRKLQALLEQEIKRAELAKNKDKIKELNQKFAEVSAQRLKFEVLL